MVLEYHGDWVQTLAVQASESWLKRLTRPLRQRWVRQACQRLSRRALGIVAIGPDLADKYVPAAKPHLVTTNNTMLEQEYRRRESVELKSPPRLLVVGELVRHKGWQVLLAAVQQLRATIGRMEVAFVGDGPDRSLIEQSARATGLDGVLLPGRRAHGPALYAEYQRADAFVFPSLAGEGVPRVVHEAMALGCPVIATSNGSVGWQLRDGAGLLVPAGDPAALAAAIGRVLTDAALRRRLSDQGFARALEHTYEKQVAAIVRFVRAVVPAGLLAPARSSQES
jgi:glycosyltransferase involved in cell wall biosynthesis